MENLPPTYVRFFTNIVSIMDKTKVLNINANKYIVQNESSYKNRDKNYKYPFLSDFLLNTAIITIKHNSEEKNLNEFGVEKGIDYKTRTLNGFIKKSYPHWQKIIEKDSDYFVSFFDNIFENIPYGKNELKNLFIYKKLDETHFYSDEDLNLIWTRIHAMVRISIKHIIEHNKNYENNETEENLFKDIDLAPYMSFLITR